jgi:hypothetical protein
MPEVSATYIEQVQSPGPAQDAQRLFDLFNHPTLNKFNLHCLALNREVWSMGRGNACSICSLP